MDQYRVKYSLRIIGVNNEFVDLFKEDCVDYEFKVSPFFKNKNHSVIVVELNEKFQPDSIRKFLDNHGDGLEVDIFISLSTNTDSLIAEIPGFVVDVMRGLPFKVHLSFTYIEE